ncbi:hypothetical protein CTA1_1727 [Colletotrichum tanaceti]|uniref:Uncharacterized protein n=1 Tax=Colletotrichum tanaceti TaxID=1306861 RepID=A0A4U6X015_9PEZI|nr:hypothetical protein CTA1_1727 [Colletotrichum tanaceti]
MPSGDYDIWDNIVNLDDYFMAPLNEPRLGLTRATQCTNGTIMHAWETTADELSGRALACAKDKLAALAGVATIIIGLVLGNSVRDRYLAGLLGVSACPVMILETGEQRRARGPSPNIVHHHVFVSLAELAKAGLVPLAEEAAMIK